MKDYGRCNELDAAKTTFCLNFFKWIPNFSLWSDEQTKMVCGKVGSKIEDESVTENYCAFVISRVYSSYSTYIEKLEDSVISDVT